MTMSQIQAVLFDKYQYTTSQARSKLKQMGLQAIKPVHTTVNYHRYRIREPSEFNRFTIKKTSKGILLVLGFYS